MSDTNYSGYQDAWSTGSDQSAHDFLVGSQIGKIWTIAVVLVQACTTQGTVGPVGFVNVLPLVHQQNLLGQVQPHETIYNLPYIRIQGGTTSQNAQNNNVNAIIIDPQPNDIGLALIASRDISNVKQNKAASAPGSWRQYDPADGIYLGGILNAQPTQYIQFVQPTNDNNNVQGINIVDFYGNTIALGKNGITITDTNNNVITTSSSGINLTDCNGNVINMQSGQISMTTDLLAVSGNITSNGKHVGYTHIHSGVTTGTGETGTPAN